MKVEAFRYMMFCSVEHKIPNWCLVYKGVDHSTNEYIWRLWMPVTEQFEELRASAHFVAAHCIPEKIHAKLEYWVEMRELLEKARDVAPMSGDLNPLSPEEKNLFGCRVIEPNPLFPKKLVMRSPRNGWYNNEYSNIPPIFE